jgi:hypothetical protein
MSLVKRFGSMYFTQLDHLFLPIAKQNHAKSRKKIAGIQNPVRKQTAIANSDKTPRQPPTTSASLPLVSSFAAIVSPRFSSSPES